MVLVGLDLEFKNLMLSIGETARVSRYQIKNVRLPYFSLHEAGVR